MSKTCSDEEMHSRYRKMRVNGKEMPVHRHIMEQILGRPLDKFEFVHHVNGNRYDNRPENLQILTPKEHKAHHPNPFTPETRAKLSASLKGRHWTVKNPRTQEYRDRVAVQMKGNQYGLGHIHTQEHKAKISATLKRLYSTGQRKHTGGRKSKISG